MLYIKYNCLKVSHSSTATKTCSMKDHVTMDVLHELTEECDSKDSQDINSFAEFYSV